MGSIAYNFLAESFLFNQSYITNQYANVSEKELNQELNSYRHFILKNVNALEEDVSNNPSNLKLFTGTTKPLFSLLKQTAFYLDQIIIADPLFPLTQKTSAAAKTFNKYLQMNPENTLNRQRIAEQAKYLKDLTPMIAANFIKIMPTTLFSEPPENIPYRYSENGFSDVLPESLMKFYQENSVIETGNKTSAGILFDRSQKVSRHILVRFKDHEIEDAKGYILQEQIVNSVNEKERTVEFVTYLPKELPSQEKFDRWVSQSVNQTAEHSYHRLLIENELASRFKASYLCTTPFAFNLLEEFFSPENTIQNHTTNSLMQLDLPFFQNVNIDTLMKVRLEDGEAFQNLRLELDKQFKELRLINDPHELKIKTENIIHEIFEVQLTQVEQKMRQIKRQLGAEAALAAGGLLGVVQSGGISLIALAIAMAQGYKSYNEYLTQKQQNPAFFLWKVHR